MSKIGIIGGGVAGLFAAYTLLKKFNGENIVIFEKGKLIEKRKCPAGKDKQCMHCNICSITSGIGGSGAYSDSKLNLDNHSKIGGSLGEFYKPKELEDLFNDVLKIYYEFGMDPNLKQFGHDDNEETVRIKEKIKNNPNMELAECDTIHLGTDRSRELYREIQDYILAAGVKISKSVAHIENMGEKFLCNGEIFDYIIIATGRSGNSYLKELTKEIGVEFVPSRIDIGVRVETTNEVMKDINDNFYEAKIFCKGEYDDEVRTFCSNPSGVVASEQWDIKDGKIFTVNGHAYADPKLKTKNTNFALLVTKNFNGDLDDPLEDYVYSIIKMTNKLANNGVMVQSLEDLKNFRRSTEESLKKMNLTPTLKAFPGDLSNTIPYRVLKSILDAIEILDEVCPGLNDGKNTLLYGIEAKFHSNKAKINQYGETNIPGIYCIGDCSGYTRGIMQAAAHGILAATSIINKHI